MKGPPRMGSLRDVTTQAANLSGIVPVVVCALPEPGDAASMVFGITGRSFRGAYRPAGACSVQATRRRVPRFRQPGP